MLNVRVVDKISTPGVQGKISLKTTGQSTEEGFNASSDAKKKAGLCDLLVSTRKKGEEVT